MEQSSLPFSIISSQPEHSEKFAIFRVRILSQIDLRAEIVLVSPPIKELIGLGDPHDLQSWIEKNSPGTSGTGEKGRTESCSGNEGFR